MSYLKSIFADIEGAGASNSAPSAPASRSPATQAMKKDGTTTDGASNGVIPAKRSFEGGLDGAQNKLSRKESSYSGSARPAALTSTSSQSPVKKEPYRGTAMASAPSALPSRPPLKTNNSSTPNSGPSAASTATAAPSKAPVKGSYAELLARGKASQPKDIMKIQNKKAAEPTLATRRDRKLQLNRTRSGSREVLSAGEASDGGIRKKRPGYKGASRASSAAPSPKSPKPTRPAYTGTARTNSGPITARSLKGAPPGKKEIVRYAGYASWGDEDEGVEDDLEDGEMSDALSDMEANVFDVDEEEELSMRAAKKEDAEELAKLNEMERKKRVRKETLERMAAEKRKKKRVL